MPKLRLASSNDDAPGGTDREKTLNDLVVAARRAALLYEEGQAPRTVFITAARMAERHLAEGPS